MKATLSLLWYLNDLFQWAHAKIRRSSFWTVQHYEWVLNVCNVLRTLMKRKLFLGYAIGWWWKWKLYFSFHLEIKIFFEKPTYLHWNKNKKNLSENRTSFFLNATLISCCFPGTEIRLWDVSSSTAWTSSKSIKEEEKEEGSAMCSSVQKMKTLLLFIEGNPSRQSKWIPALIHADFMFSTRPGHCKDYL